MEKIWLDIMYIYWIQSPIIIVISNINEYKRINCLPFLRIIEREGKITIMSTDCTFIKLTLFFFIVLYVLESQGKITILWIGYTFN